MGKCEQCGTHKGPGKFEGEPCWAEALWDGADIDFYDGETPVSVIQLDANDVQAFPCSLDDSDIGKVVLLWEDDQGFVFTRGPMTPEEARRIEADCDRDNAIADGE